MKMGSGRTIQMLLVAALTLGLTGSATARDWYVMEGARRGKGTQEKPFKDPQKAIEKAVSGDVIHVTQGTYHGKFKIGYLVIDKRGLTLVGGYEDGSFEKRNPFLYPTIIAEHPENKNTSFAGGYIRVDVGTGVNDHQSTTIDGFWFDRAEQNGYTPPTAPPARCPGCLAVPAGSNTRPVIDFEHPDCHIRNCVFMNTALYGVRMNGDGSSLVNNLFLNVNYAGIEIFGKNRKLGDDYPFHRFRIENNSFVSVWNCCSLERGAGSFLFHSGNAEITVRNNIFHLSNGNAQSMGYAIKDERNYKGDPWVILEDNSFSQLRGGLATIYLPDLSASVTIEDVGDFGDSPWDAGENDWENPFYKFDKQWLERYAKAVPRQDPGEIKVDMDDFNKMRRMLGLPLDAGTVESGGQFLAWRYPIEHVKTGAFWRPQNEELEGRGLQADGPFEVVRAKLVEEAVTSGADAPGGAPPADREYEEVTFDELWEHGEEWVDKPVRFEAYYSGKDSGFFSGFGDNAVYYLEGTGDDSHVILKLRGVPRWKQSYFLKGYVAKGSAAEAYLDKKAKRTCSARGNCTRSFTVSGVIRKAGAKLFGKVPQVVIAIDDLSR